MQVVRIYTGDDGESHFEEIDLPYEKVAESERTAVENAENIHFRRNAARSDLRDIRRLP